MVKFDSEAFITCRIRAARLGRSLGICYSEQTAAMDLLTTHKVCPIDFMALSKADDGDFGHDVMGIRRHLNRETGMLEDCFIPRYALRENTVNVEGR